MITIKQLSDIPKALGLHVVQNISSVISDAIEKDQKIEDVCPTSADFTFITGELSHTNPHKESIKGKEVEFTLDPLNELDIKDLIDDNFDNTALSTLMATTTEITEYNLTEEDKADMLKKSRTYATSVIKKCCKAFSVALNEEFGNNFEITVETYMSGPVFSIIGYFETNTDGSCGKAIHINPEVFSDKIQADCKFLKKAGERSEQINKDYENVKETDFCSQVVVNISPLLPQVNAFGKKLATFARGFKALKASAKDATESQKELPADTVAQSDLPDDTTEEENT